MDAILKSLNLKAINPGVNSGSEKFDLSKAKKLSVINPATLEEIAQIQLGQLKDYEKIVALSAEQFQVWRCVPAPKRGELIRQIADALREKKSALGKLITAEAGKIPAEAEGEVQEMIDMADFAVGQSRMLYGKTMPSERPFHRHYEQWHPLGITGVISAFNFPVAVWSWNAFLAAICGNTVIWKPSKKVALCALAVQQICNQVCEKAGYENIFSVFIPEDNSISEKFVNDVRVPLISFTGSIAVGKEVAQNVAKRLGRTILELSGNNAVIIDETADLSLVIPAVVFGAVGTAGQRCTSIRRLIVHHSRYDEITKKLIAAYKQIKIGNPVEKNILMGPLIDKKAVENFVNALDVLKKHRAEIIFGGKVLKQKGFFVEPTLVQAENHWEIVQQETFAPILYIIPYENFADAVAMQNNVPQGLSSALFTQNLIHSEYFLSAKGSDCGIANINTSTSGAEIGGAFGGEKETGGGREAGSDSWKAYMRRQTVVINWSGKITLAQGIEFAV